MRKTLGTSLLAAAWMLLCVQHSQGQEISINITIKRIVAVSVSAPADQAGDPGQTVTHQFQIKNAGNNLDTFTLAATSSKNWPLSFPSQIGPLAADETAVASVQVTIPQKAKPGMQDFFTLTVTSQADESVSDSACVTTTVAVESNNPPVLNPIGDRTVNEGEVLTIEMTATDPDGDKLNFRVIDKPPRSTLQQTDDAARFVFSPNYRQSGMYRVTFLVTDHGRPRLSDFETITITVIDVEKTGGEKD